MSTLPTYELMSSSDSFDIGSTVSYKGIAMSLTGQYIAVCINNASGPNGGIYVSIDYGVSWSQANSTLTNWSSIAMSSTGQYIAACINGGSGLNVGIYVSNNYGFNWSQTNSILTNWYSIAMSSSGQYITACINGIGGSAGIYISNDYGAINSWGRTSAFATSWASIAMSSSGQYTVACINSNINNNNGIYLNYQYSAGGTSWYKIAATEYFNSIAMSSSGQKISTFQNTNNTLYNYNLYNTNVTQVLTPYFGILQNYQFDLNPGYYINIIDPQTSGLGGTGKIYILNITSGYSTYLLFRSIYNSTGITQNPGITQNQLYILNDPTLFHDTNISIYFSYIYGTVTITTNNIPYGSFNVTVEGSFNYNLPESLSSSSGQVPTSSVPINFQ